jgi:hypothetical protein
MAAMTRFAPYVPGSLWLEQLRLTHSPRGSLPKKAMEFRGPIDFPVFV